MKSPEYFMQSFIIQTNDKNLLKKILSTKQQINTILYE